MSTADRQDARRGGFSVVIADDADDVRFMLRLILESTFDVLAEAADGDEAVQVVREHRPDVVVLDVSMPVMDGLQAIPLIREASPATKILMLSGLDTSYVGSAAREAGADAYIEKGSPTSKLIEAVNLLCS